MPFFHTFCSPPATLVERVYGLLVPSDVTGRLNELLYRHYMYKDLPENGRNFYESYNAEIQRIVPKKNLLVMNVKEGWGPLCKFLGKDVPGYPFPRVNDAGTFQQNVEKTFVSINRAVVINAVKTVGAVLAIVIGFILVRPGVVVF